MSKILLDKKLGLYDSGIGGLTVLKEILNSSKIPPETIYLADFANCPLGDKPTEEILEIVTRQVKFLMDSGCQLVVLACNTATCIAIQYLQQEFLPRFYPNNKVLGIIRPVSEVLLSQKISQKQKIGLLATPATVKSGYFLGELKSFGFQNTFAIPCEGLAGSIELGDLNLIEQTLVKSLNKYHQQLKEVEVIILGCTHYPIIQDLIKEKLKIYTKKDLVILNQAVETAYKLKLYMQNHPEIEVSFSSQVTFLASEPKGFKKLTISTDEVKQLKIAKFRKKYY